MWPRPQGMFSFLAPAGDGSEPWPLAWLTCSLPTAGKIVSEQLRWHDKVSHAQDKTGIHAESTGHCKFRADLRKSVSRQLHVSRNTHGHPLLIAAPASETCTSLGTARGARVWVRHAETRTSHTLAPVGGWPPTRAAAAGCLVRARRPGCASSPGRHRTRFGW